MSERNYSKRPSADKGPRGDLGTQHPSTQRGAGSALNTACLDLRGIKCPLNWARAKVRLETLARGAELELIVDDPKGARDIPRAAEAEGYAVITVERHEAAWRIVIHV